MKNLLLSAIALAVLAPSLAQAAPGDGYMYNGHRYDRIHGGPAWTPPPKYVHRNWKRGQRLPAEYRRVEVNNWRAYHLAPPPRGYHYVRVGDDIVLTAIASGLIGAVIANAFAN
jgi:Ni/Co efflux regulator RcnB